MNEGFAVCLSSCTDHTVLWSGPAQLPRLRIQNLGVNILLVKETDVRGAHRLQVQLLASNSVWRRDLLEDKSILEQTLHWVTEQTDGCPWTCVCKILRVFLRCTGALAVLCLRQFRVQHCSSLSRLDLPFSDTHGRSSMFELRTHPYSPLIALESCNPAPPPPKLEDKFEFLTYQMTAISTYYVWPSLVNASPSVPCFPKLIGIIHKWRILKTRTWIIIENPQPPILKVDQWRRLLILYFSLFQLGVRITIHRYPLWLIEYLGHIRPFCVLAPRLVREPKNVVVTFITGSNVLEKTRAEVSRQFLDNSSDSAEALQRIR